MITFINNTAVHSGHCEAEVLRHSRKALRITGFPMPVDLTEKYGL